MECQKGRGGKCLERRANLFFVLPGIGGAQVSGCFKGCADLVQVSRSDTGARCTFDQPTLARGEDFRPEGVGPALDRLDGMDGTPGWGKEMAMAAFGRAKTQGAAGPDDEAGLEGGRRHAEEGGHADEVVLGDVNKTLPVATADASWLALETENRAQIVTWKICFGCVRQGLRFILNNVGCIEWRRQ